MDPAKGPEVKVPVAVTPVDPVDLVILPTYPLEVEVFSVTKTSCARDVTPNMRRVRCPKRLLLVK